jgi:hypothetical protein
MCCGYLVCCWYSLLAAMQILCVSFILTPNIVIWGFYIFVVSLYISRFSVFSRLNFMLVEVFLLLDHILMGCDCIWQCCFVLCWISRIFASHTKWSAPQQAPKV